MTAFVEGRNRLLACLSHSDFVQFHATESHPHGSPKTRSPFSPSFTDSHPWSSLACPFFILEFTEASGLGGLLSGMFALVGGHQEKQALLPKGAVAPPEVKFGIL